ncbi:MAG TPA: hypothetical protein DC047_03020 [Blastocatellia bacterium]|nr:hypothetical protein [Blastocatellia bacterium]
MTEAEIIEHFRRARQEQARFFSNAAKPERERWVVAEFLKTLSVTFSDDELVSPNESDDIDVVFRDANFQVKELPEPNCLRSSEVRDDLKRAETATKPMELFGPLVATDIVYEDAYPSIQRFASDSRYPPASRAKLDLLVYVTHHHAVVNRANQPSELSPSGWRSISCLFGKHAYVLVAANDAPTFLRA